MPATRHGDSVPIAEIERTYEALGQTLRSRGRGAPGFYPGGVGSGPDAESPGEAFIRSDAYERWLADFPNGGPSQAQAGSFRSPPVEAKYSLANGSPGARALVTAADASAGTLVPPDYRGLMEPGLVRPLTVRNLLTVLPTSSDTVEWVREASRVSAAAPVAEATALTGTSGTKPEGGLTFQAIQGVVRTFAVWIPATKRIIQDAPGLRAYIDQYLMDDLGLEVEDQVMAGPGGGENFLGLLNDPDIPTVGSAGDGLNVLDRLRRAKRDVMLNGRTIPNGAVLHPNDAEKVDTLKAVGSGEYFGGGPFGTAGQRTVWGMPIVESDVVPNGTAVVGDFRRAVLFERQTAEISLGTVGDDFIRNIVRVLAEYRAAFALTRPKAFVEVNLAAAP